MTGRAKLISASTLARARERRVRAATLLALSVATGTLFVSYASAVAAGPVELTIGAPTNVLPKNGILHGTVNPAGETIESCEFEYGSPVQGYTHSAPCNTIPTGSGSEAVSGEATEFHSDTAYLYRLFVRAEGTEVFSAEGVLATPPTVVGSALASGVTSFAAMLTGLIGAQEVTPTYHFVYGLTSAYGSQVPSPDAAAGSGGVQSVSQTVTGLQPGTTYHFALAVSNFGGGVSVGPDETFTTRPLVPPAASTGAAEAVGQKAATLTGSVDPEALDTTYCFQYGTSTAYGAVWPSVPAHAGAGSSGEAVAVALENLQPETTYHYRLVASNEDGTTYGADETFTTAPHLVSVIQVPPGAAPGPGVAPPAKEGKKNQSRPKKHGKKKRVGHRKTKRGKKK